LKINVDFSVTACAVDLNINCPTIMSVYGTLDKTKAIICLLLMSLFPDINFISVGCEIHIPVKSIL